MPSTPRARSAFALPLACLILALPLPARAATYEAGGQLGFTNGPGGEAMLRLIRPSTDLPLDLRFGLQLVAGSAGNAEEARHVFINDNENGTPEESAHTWIARFDVLHAVSPSWLPGRGWNVYGGMRFAHHTSHFEYVGGNEAFDVTSKQWGYGVGLEGSFPVAARTNLVIGAGVDHFLSATLTGHDTSYSPDGTNVNGREDYGWADADHAVAQPKVEPRVMLGLTRRFGK